MDRSWKVRYDLKTWQLAAIAEWNRAGRRGVVEAATGTGKTAVALAAIEELRSEYGERLRIAIVVPTKVLAHQWREQLEGNLRVRGSLIGEHHSDARVEWQQSHPVLIAVVNTARSRLAGVLDGWRQRGMTTLLVVDECHRAGSEYNSKIFDGHYDHALGLSATPERDDLGHHEFVYPGLGDPVYRYPLLDALDDYVLAPVTSINLYVDFDAAEAAQWQVLSDAIGDVFRNLTYRYPYLEGIADGLLFKEIGKLAEREDPLALKLQKLLADRRELLSSATARRACLRAILTWLGESGKRALVFHETIAAATESHTYLSKTLNAKAGLDHSALARVARDTAMDDFRKERSQVLVAVRALDEGVDVPDASVAVIAAGSRSPRQRIQRFGRVLRPAAGKEALVFTILVRNTPEEAAVGGRDAALLGPTRVRHHRWPGTPIEQAASASVGAYRPDEPAYTVEDLLTLSDLGLWESSMAVAPRRSRPAGGYGTVEAEFSPNAWYAVDDIRDGVGVPAGEFDRIRRDIRRAFRLSLDSEKAADDTLIHGSEIDAVRRRWHENERKRVSLRRR